MISNSLIILIIFLLLIGIFIRMLLIQSSRGSEAEQTEFPCPCCGHVVFCQPPGSHGKCPVCFWEDDLSQLRFPETSGANQVSLIVGQNNYQKYGVCDERLIDYVRPANSNEPIELNWRPVSSERDYLEYPNTGIDYRKTNPNDRTVLYYWRETYWRKPAQLVSELSINDLQAKEGLPDSTELTVEFRGNAKEYFRIWIVNLCLTLLTLGIFSAWAKVRKKRYFYGHTLLDGTPFQYLGQPIPILKGRVIAAFVFLLYYASSHYFTFALPYILAAGTVLAPWVVVRSAAFNARYSAFRNITFHFDGKYLDAIKKFSLGGFVPIIIFGTIFNWFGNSFLEKLGGVLTLCAVLAFPWWIRQLKGFIINHTSYGNNNGTFSATGWQFFKIYFIAAVTIFAIVSILAILLTALFPSVIKSPGLLTRNAFFVSIPFYAGYIFAFAYLQANSSNLIWNHTMLGPIRFQSTLSLKGLSVLYITNGLGIIMSLGLLIPWAVMRTLKYRLNNLRMILQGDLDNFSVSETEPVPALAAELQDVFDLEISL